VWKCLRNDVESYYKDKPREHLPLSQQKEFRAIKNMVVREAENIRLGVLTFEDEQMADETGGMRRLPSLSSPTGGWRQPIGKPKRSFETRTPHGLRFFLPLY